MATTPVPTQVTEYQTGFAPVIAPYAERLLGRAEAMFEDPYMQYQGERFAQFSPLQQQAFTGAQAMEAAPQLRDASSLAGLAGLRALGYGYQPGQFTNQFVAPQQFQPSSFTAPGVSSRDLTTFQMGPAERVRTQSFARPGSAEAFMSPYMQNVVDIQQREAQRQADIAGTQRAGKYTRAGAFGGARQAIENAEAARNLATQKGDIQATGLQAAYQQAQQQFNAEQAARLQAQLANQQAGLTVGGQNLGAALGVQQLGAQQGLQASLANQQAQMQAQQLAEQSKQFGYGQQLQAAGLGAQYGQAAQQLGEQSSQFGAGLGLQGLQAAMGAAGQLGQLGQNQFGQNMAINQLQAQYGGQQQQQMQNILGAQYQDFLNYQNYPYKQLGFMSDILRGAPLSQTGSSVYQQAPSMTSQLAGLGTAAFGASKLFGMKDGGAVEDIEYREKPAGLADLAIYNMGR
jgi:hypothetical protein